MTPAALATLPRASDSAPETRVAAGRGKSVVVAGAGGVIGSHLVPHLGRMPDVSRVTLIDRDVYESTNLRSQAITARDVGKAKAVVQAQRLRQINPALHVQAIADAVENVPLGLLRCDVILAALDSRAARRTVHRAAWRLGVPWIDSGVHGDDLLARVNVYVPRAGQPCLECAWQPRDYETLDQAYPCDPSAQLAPPTNAPSSIGALAASLEALECQKLLSGQWEWAAIGRQVLINASAHTHFVTRFPVNPACRFDHAVWNIELLNRRPAELTLRGALACADPAVHDDPSLALGVEGMAFLRTLTCTGCGFTKELLRLSGRLRAAERTCVRCDQPMRAAGFDMTEWLRAADLAPAMLARSLCSAGLRSGDVLTVSGASGPRRFQIGSPEA
jgi:hypothetical protein